MIINNLYSLQIKHKRNINQSFWSTIRNIAKMQTFQHPFAQIISIRIAMWFITSRKKKKNKITEKRLSKIIPVIMLQLDS